MILQLRAEVAGLRAELHVIARETDAGIDRAVRARADHVGGSAGDRFGRRRVFLIGLAGFAAASFACGVAPSALWLIGARLAQGMAAALLIPASLAIVSAAYTEETRGPAIGTWAAAGALTGLALSSALGDWEPSERLSAVLIGAAAGTLIGGVYGALSHDERGGAARPARIGIRIAF